VTERLWQLDYFRNGAIGEEDGELCSRLQRGEPVGVEEIARDRRPPSGGL